MRLGDLRNRNQTGASYSGSLGPSHWTIREFPSSAFFKWKYLSLSPGIFSPTNSLGSLSLGTSLLNSTLYFSESTGGFWDGPQVVLWFHCPGSRGSSGVKVILCELSQSLLLLLCVIQGLGFKGCGDRKGDCQNRPLPSHVG